MADFATMRAEVQDVGVSSVGITEDEYDGLPFYRHMLAGAFAGIGEHCVMFPVDTVKTRMQALRIQGSHAEAATHAARGLLRHEGVAGLYRGVTAAAMGAGPAHAVYFATYEATRAALGIRREDGEHHPLGTAAAGAVAMLAHEAMMTPWDVTKQRMQTSARPYHSAFQAAGDVLRNEGVGALYRSFRTTVVMNVPFAATQFAVYESSKTWLGGDAAREGDEGLRTQVTAGALAGGVAAALTTPLDVVKTRLQLDVHRRYASNAVLPTMRAIAAQEGVATLWRGVLPRVLYNAPSAAVCWGIYESLKNILAGNDAHRDS